MDNAKNEILKNENKIYVVRGKEVMLDFDLALLFDNETKRINESVRRNINKFPNNYSWFLSDEESNIFWSKIATKKETRGGRYKKRINYNN